MYSIVLCLTNRRLTIPARTVMMIENAVTDRSEDYLRGLAEIVAINNPSDTAPETSVSLRQRVNLASAEFSAAQESTRDPRLREIITTIISALQNARFRLFGD